MKTRTPTPQYMDKRRTPLTAGKAYCRWCNGGSPETCICATCRLYPFRMGTPSPGTSAIKLKDIHAYCLNCVGSSENVRTCTAFKTFEGQPPCALWPHREGKRAVSPKYREERCEQAKRQLREPGPGATFQAKTLLDFIGEG